MKKLAIIVTILTLGISSATAPAMAMGPMEVFGNKIGSENANILDKCADQDTGEKSIKCLLELAADILSVGVGILGVIGISVSGVQYLTAGGSEEKTRKAKRRIFEIVIGLALYAVLYYVLRWLLPNFE